MDLDTRAHTDMEEIERYLNPKLITFFKARDRDDAIYRLVELCHDKGVIPATEPFLNKIQEREKIVSTGIGMSVAIPHAKLPHFDDFFIAIGVLERGVNWQALDGHPVRLIFLIGGPENKQPEYLKILSHLTNLIKSETLRKKMLTTNSAVAMMKLLRE